MKIWLPSAELFQSTSHTPTVWKFLLSHHSGLSLRSFLFTRPEHSIENWPAGQACTLWISNQIWRQTEAPSLTTSFQNKIGQWSCGRKAKSLTALFGKDANWYLPWNDNTDSRRNSASNWMRSETLISMSSTPATTPHLAGLIAPSVHNTKRGEGRSSGGAFL